MSKPRDEFAAIKDLRCKGRRQKPVSQLKVGGIERSERGSSSDGRVVVRDHGVKEYGARHVRNRAHGQNATGLQGAKEAREGRDVGWVLNVADLRHTAAAS